MMSGRVVVELFRHGRARGRGRAVCRSRGDAALSFRCFVGTHADLCHEVDQPSVGCMVCHGVTCSNARPTRNTVASSKSLPVTIRLIGMPSVNPAVTTRAGWPVKLVIVRLSLRGGERKASQLVIR